MVDDETGQEVSLLKLFAQVALQVVEHIDAEIVGTFVAVGAVASRETSPFQSKNP